MLSCLVITHTHFYCTSSPTQVHTHLRQASEEQSGHRQDKTIPFKEQIWDLVLLHKIYVFNIIHCIIILNYFKHLSLSTTYLVVLKFRGHFKQQQIVQDHEAA